MLLAARHMRRTKTAAEAWTVAACPPKAPTQNTAKDLLSRQDVSFACCSCLQTSSRVAPEDAIRALQASLPPNLAKPQQPLELEHVSPQLLVPPVERGMLTLAVAGGNLELGDRVACLRNTGKLWCTLLCWLPSHRTGLVE